MFEELRGFRINFLNKLHKDEKHQTRVSLSLELVSDAYLTANRTYLTSKTTGPRFDSR